MQGVIVRGRLQDIKRRRQKISLARRGPGNRAITDKKQIPFVHKQELKKRDSIPTADMVDEREEVVKHGAQEEDPVDYERDGSVKYEVAKRDNIDTGVRELRGVR